MDQNASLIKKMLSIFRHLVFVVHTHSNSRCFIYREFTRGCSRIQVLFNKM